MSIYLCQGLFWPLFESLPVDCAVALPATFCTTLRYCAVRYVCLGTYLLQRCRSNLYGECIFHLVIWSAVKERLAGITIKYDNVSSSTTLRKDVQSSPSMRMYLAWAPHPTLGGECAGWRVCLSLVWNSTTKYAFQFLALYRYETEEIMIIKVIENKIVLGTSNNSTSWTGEDVKS